MSTGASHPSDLTRLAIRRQAALRRNARRVVAEEEDEEDEKSGGSRRDPSTPIDTRMIGTVYDADDPSNSAAAKLIRSSHDERRAINQLIYGRLNQIESTEFVPKAFVSSRGNKATTAATSSTTASTASTGAIDLTSSSDLGSSTLPRSRPQQRPEDFMDEEDRSGSGPLAASGIVARGGTFTSALPSTTSGPTTHIGIPAKANKITMQLLKACGWRADADKSTASRKRKPSSSSERVYGASLPPGMMIENSTLKPDTSSMSDAQAFRLMERNEEEESINTIFTRKSDTYGLGFTPYSQLSSAARTKHDQAYAPLTFIRPKIVDPQLANPKTYSIIVPKDFDGKHRFPPPPPAPISNDFSLCSHPESSSTSASSTSSTALIQQWRGKMDAARRGALLGEPPVVQTDLMTSLPLPPLPPPIATPPSTTPTSTTTDSEAAEKHRLHLLRLQQQQQARAGGGTFMPPQFPSAPPSPPSSLPQLPPPPLNLTSDGRVDLRAAIAAATAAAATIKQEKERKEQEEREAQRKKERKARWGPLPITEEAAQAFPTAAAFLSQLQTSASSAAPDNSTQIPATSAPTTAASLSLAQTFPKFMVGGVQEPSSTAASTPAAPLASSAFSQHAAKAIMSNFVEAGATAATDANAMTDVPSTTTPSSQSISTSSVKAKQLPPPSNEYEVAARMKQWGRATRKVEAWHPHPLLYKRFGVPQPSKFATSAAANKSSKNTSTGAAVPGFPSFVESATTLNSVSLPPGLINASSTASSSSSAMIDIAAEIQREEEAAMQAELMMDDEPTTSDIKAAENTPPEEKPSLDLFKAIFENEDEEEVKPKPKPKSQPIQDESSMKIESPINVNSSSTAAATQVVKSLHHPSSTSATSKLPQKSTSSSIDTREIIAIDLDDLDEDDDMGVQITGSKSSNSKFVPASYHSSNKDLKFVPASNQTNNNKRTSHKSHHQPLQPLEKMNSSGGRIGFDGEVDELYDDMEDVTSMPSLKHTNVTPGATFVPPPVRVHAPPLRPPTVPATAWPFPRLTESASSATSHAPSQGQLISSSSSSSSHHVPSSKRSHHDSTTKSDSTTVTTISSTPSALLEQLLTLRKQQKKLKKEKKKKEKSKKKKKEKAFSDSSSSSESDDSHSDSPSTSKKHKKKKSKQ